MATTARPRHAIARRPSRIGRRVTRTALAAAVALTFVGVTAGPAAAVAADGASCMGQAASEAATREGGLGGVATSIAGPGVGVEVVSPNARTRGGSDCLF